MIQRQFLRKYVLRKSILIFIFLIFMAQTSFAGFNPGDIVYWQSSSLGSITAQTPCQMNSEQNYDLIGKVIATFENNTVEIRWDLCNGSPTPQNWGNSFFYEKYVSKLKYGPEIGDYVIYLDEKNQKKVGQVLEINSASSLRLRHMALNSVGSFDVSMDRIIKPLKLKRKNVTGIRPGDRVYSHFQSNNQYYVGRVIRVFENRTVEVKWEFIDGQPADVKPFGYYYKANLSKQTKRMGDDNWVVYLDEDGARLLGKIEEEIKSDLFRVTPLDSSSAMSSPEDLPRSFTVKLKNIYR